jgi:hypothetical protein
VCVREREREREMKKLLPTKRLGTRGYEEWERGRQRGRERKVEKGRKRGIKREGDNGRER